MEDLKPYNVLCYDYGNFFQIAQRLAESDGFGNIYYYCPYVHNGFPDHRPIDIGRNVPGVIRVREWAEVINDIDIVYFCDCHEPALQMCFQNIGKKVFGSRFASDLEHDRKATKELMRQLDLPLNEYFVANGMDELEAILKENNDVYVKSSLRGDMESWKSKSFLLSKGELTRMRAAFGTYANKETFIVEKPIESIAEIGIDTFVVDGMYPEMVMSGIEIKDTGYYGRIVPYSSLPAQLKNVTDAFATIFRDYNYRGWHSNEVIISEDKKGYLIDPTMRNASPPTDLALKMITNYPEVAWKVANGILPILKYEYTHGVQLVIKSESAKTDPSPIIVPEGLKSYVKIKNLTIDDDGTWYYVPQGVEMTEIGSVVGVGNSLAEALGMAAAIADSIQGFDLKVNHECIQDAKKQIQNLKDSGISYLQ